MHSWKLEITNKHGEEIKKCMNCNILKKEYKFPKIIGNNTVYAEYIKGGKIYYRAPECKTTKPKEIKKEPIQESINFPKIYTTNLNKF